jgi:hypothetical protein
VFQRLNEQSRRGRLLLKWLLAGIKPGLLAQSLQCCRLEVCASPDPRRTHTEQQEASASQDAETIVGVHEIQFSYTQGVVSVRMIGEDADGSSLAVVTTDDTVGASAPSGRARDCEAWARKELADHLWEYQTFLESQPPLSLPVGHVHFLRMTLRDRSSGDISHTEPVYDPSYFYTPSVAAMRAVDDAVDALTVPASRQQTLSMVRFRLLDYLECAAATPSAPCRRLRSGEASSTDAAHDDEDASEAAVAASAAVEWAADLTAEIGRPFVEFIVMPDGSILPARSASCRVTANPEDSQIWDIGDSVSEPSVPPSLPSALNTTPTIVSDGRAHGGRQMPPRNSNDAWSLHKHLAKQFCRETSADGSLYRIALCLAFFSRTWQIEAIADAAAGGTGYLAEDGEASGQTWEAAREAWADLRDGDNVFLEMEALDEGAIVGAVDVAAVARARSLGLFAQKNGNAAVAAAADAVTRKSRGIIASVMVWARRGTAATNRGSKQIHELMSLLGIEDTDSTPSLDSRPRLELKQRRSITPYILGYLVMRALVAYAGGRGIDISLPQLFSAVASRELREAARRAASPLTEICNKARSDPKPPRGVADRLMITAIFQSDAFHDLVQVLGTVMVLRMKLHGLLTEACVPRRHTVPSVASTPHPSAIAASPAPACGDDQQSYGLLRCQSTFLLAIVGLDDPLVRQIVSSCVDLPA